MKMRQSTSSQISSKKRERKFINRNSQKFPEKFVRTFFLFRITFHKNIFLCHGHKWKSIDVLLDGDYYMIFDERIYTASYPANVILKNVALTRYTTGKIFIIKVRVRSKVSAICKRGSYE